jgi:putative addiction module killer protein
MIEVRKTEIFAKWFDNLKDRKARARIQARIDRIEMGNFGDVVSVGEGVSKFRIFYGPGYRIYFVQKTLLLWFFYLVAINLHKNGISSKLKKFPDK